jgi:hypothetical protein
MPARSITLGKELGNPMGGIPDDKTCAPGQWVLKSKPFSFGG